MDTKPCKIIFPDTTFGFTLPSIEDFITISFPPIIIHSRQIDVQNEISGFVEKMDYEELDNGTIKLYSIDLLIILNLSDYLDGGNAHHQIPLHISMHSDFHISRINREITKTADNT